MIHKILNFSDTLVSSIMIPREHMFTLPYDLDRTSLIKEIKEHHFSRIPIYKQEKNNFIGVLYAKDLHAVGEAEAPSSTPVEATSCDLLTWCHRIKRSLTCSKNFRIKGYTSLSSLMNMVARRTGYHGRSPGRTFR